MPAGVTGLPRQAPLAPLLHALFDRIVSDAESRGIAWGEWLALSTAALFALNAPDSLRAMMRYAVRHEDNLRPLAERVNRACLMREVGLKCLGLIGTPRVRCEHSRRPSTTLLRSVQKSMPTRSLLRPCQQRRVGTCES